MRPCCHAGTFWFRPLIHISIVLQSCDILQLPRSHLFLMQMSGQYMLLQHHGLKGPEVTSLSSAIAVNYSLTHLDLCDNRCVVVPVNDEVANFWCSCFACAVM